MNRILELREKRAKAWDAAKKFLDAKTGPDGLVSAEDSATYDKMEADVLALGNRRRRTTSIPPTTPSWNPAGNSTRLTEWICWAFCASARGAQSGNAKRKNPVESLSTRFGLI